jgi:hypothetical protein
MLKKTDEIKEQTRAATVVPTANRATVTERALLQRLNRKLAEIDEVVRKSRPIFDRGGIDPHWPIYDSNTGKYFRIDTRRNWLEEAHVDLEALGREVGVLRA